MTSAFRMGNFGNTTEVAAALAEVELASCIDTDVPTESRLVLARPVKLAVSRLAGFYARFLSTQITLLAQELVRAMRLLAEATNSKVALFPTVRHKELPSAVTSHIIDHLSGARGRVLVLDSATPELLDALETSGIDAYGITAGIDPTSADANLPNGSTAILACDLRDVSAGEHLAMVPNHTLGGALMTGFTDQAPVGRKLELLTGVLGICGPGARVAVVVATGDNWRARLLDEVAADLVEGHPLLPKTWEALLSTHGVTDITASQIDDDIAVVTGRQR